MKEFYMLVGLGAGLVCGALLYKHSQDAKKLVNKGENAVKQGMESAKKSMEGKQPDKKEKKQKSKA